MQPVLSILICSLYKRAGMLAVLLGNLYEQIEKLGAEDKVEVLVEVDNGEMTTGAKRNILYSDATGKYVISHDDDDKPADFYVEELLKAAESDADCFAMTGYMLTNGTSRVDWEISKDHPYAAIKGEDGKKRYRRFPNHITAIRATIAKQFKFPELYNAEDYAWALQIHQSGLIKTEYKITRGPMYVYDWWPQKNRPEKDYFVKINP
jgi:hypothetical protein